MYIHSSYYDHKVSLHVHAYHFLKVAYHLFKVAYHLFKHVVSFSNHVVWISLLHSCFFFSKSNIILNTHPIFKYFGIDSEFDVYVTWSVSGPAQ